MSSTAFDYEFALEWIIVGYIVVVRSGHYGSLMILYGMTSIEPYTYIITTATMKIMKITKYKRQIKYRPSRLRHVVITIIIGLRNAQNKTSNGQMYLSRVCFMLCFSYYFTICSIRTM